MHSAPIHLLQKPALWSNKCKDRGFLSHSVHNFYTHSTITDTEIYMEIYNEVWLADSHPVSAVTHDNLVHAQFTQLFTATYTLHCPYLLPLQEVCPKGLTQLLHYILVAIASCKQNCSPAILKKGCMKMWTVHKINAGTHVPASKQH